MRTKLAFGFFLAVLGGIGLWLWATREPNYGGKPLSFWIRGLHYENLNPTQEARTALRAMGQPAVNRLIAMLRRHDSGLKKRFVAHANKHGDVHNRFISTEYVIPENSYHARAATALGEIGPAAKAAIPALTETAKDPDLVVSGRARAALIKIRQESMEPLLRELEGPHTRDWRQTARVCQYLGTYAQPAVPLLVGGLQDTNWIVRERTMLALGGIASSPEIAVPPLIECMKDPDPMLRREAMDALSKFEGAREQIVPLFLRCILGQDFNIWSGAKFALDDMLSAEEKKKLLVPALIECLKNSDPDIRAHASSVLRREYPEAASQAGVK